MLALIFFLRAAIPKCGTACVELQQTNDKMSPVDGPRLRPAAVIARGSRGPLRTTSRSGGRVAKVTVGKNPHGLVRLSIGCLRYLQAWLERLRTAALPVSPHKILNLFINLS